MQDHLGDVEKEAEEEAMVRDPSCRRELGLGRRCRRLLVERVFRYVRGVRRAVFVPFFSGYSV